MTLVKPATQEIDLRPRILLVGFPKAGLHLATSMARVLALPASKKAQWYGNIEGNAWTMRWMQEAHERAPRAFRLFTMPIHRWWPKDMPDRRDYLGRGLYLRAHLGYTPELERLLYGYGVEVMFIYRDLRDVVVSHARHVLDDRPAQDGRGDELRHPAKAEYRAIAEKDGFEGVLLACIEGMGEYAGLFERWEMYAPWLICDWVLPMTYEEMRVKPYNAAAKFIRHLEQWEGRLHGFKNGSLSPELFVRIQAVMVKSMANPEYSPTFRKGKVGSWRKHFTPRVKECFKAHDPGWLVALGYAKDKDW